MTDTPASDTTPKPMSTMVWEDLVSSALLGTERRPLAGGAGTLDAVVRSASKTEAEAALTFGGLLGLSRSATLHTPTNQQAPNAVRQSGGPVVESRTEVARSATQLLDVLIGGTVAVAGQNDKLIGQWLSGCNRHRLRVPRSQIIPILERATQHSEHRFDAAGVVGERGVFLAARNPRWKWVHDRTTEAAALTEAGEISPICLTKADSAAKGQLVQTWRAVDADLAREAVIGALPHENAPDRTAMIRALTVGLGAKDEALLEATLDDKAKGVREAARWVAAQIPTSAFAARMTARLEPLVVTKRFPRFSISVELPELSEIVENNPSWARDGLAHGSSKSDALRRIVEATPVSWWEQTIDRPLFEVIERLIGTDTQKEVVGGICGSAMSIGRVGLTKPEWIVPLWLRLSAPVPSVKGATDVRELWWQERSSLLSMMIPSEVTSLVDLVSKDSFDQARILEALGAQDRIALVDQIAMSATVSDRIGSALIKRPEETYQLINHHNIGLLLINMSESIVEKLLEAVSDTPSLAQRLRHVQAATSLSHAITKEFP
jgi:Family of unknown function (DUF5691)